MYLEPLVRIRRRTLAVYDGTMTFSNLLHLRPQPPMPGGIDQIASPIAHLASDGPAQERFDGVVAHELLIALE